MIFRDGQIAEAASATQRRFEAEYRVSFRVSFVNSLSNGIEVSYRVGTIEHSVHISSGFLHSRANTTPHQTLVVDFLCDVFYAHLNALLRMHLETLSRDYMIPTTYRFPDEDDSHYLSRVSGAPLLADSGSSTVAPTEPPPASPLTQLPRMNFCFADMADMLKTSTKRLLELCGFTDVVIEATCEEIRVQYRSWGSVRPIDHTCTTVGELRLLLAILTATSRTTAASEVTCEDIDTRMVQL